MPTYFMIMDYTLDSTSIWDTKNSLEISVRHMSSFSLFFCGMCMSQNHRKENISKRNILAKI